jgi:tripartite-type tricarboxylate transporter receptor subunit TctC
MKLIVTINHRFSQTLSAAAFAFSFMLGFSAENAARADDVTNFYVGKQITMLVGFGVGGGGDVYARLLARHLGDHIPGQPSIIVQNMPGGGGLSAMNHLFNVAEQDGTVLMSMLSPTVLEPLMGNKNARWDASRFGWLGNLTRDFIGCVASGRSGVKSTSEAAKREIVFGATGPSASSATHPYALANILGYKTKVIAGYKGTSEIWLAMERGEVEAVCAFWASQAAVQKKAEMDSGVFVPIVQMGPTKHPLFREAPLVFDLARDEEEKAVMQLIFGPNEFSRPFAAPPNVPPARLKILQQAFWDAARSPALRAEADKQGLYVDPMNAESTSAAFNNLISMPPKRFERAAEAIREPGGGR